MMRHHAAFGFLAAVLAALAAEAPAQESGKAGFPRVFEVIPDKLNLRAGIGQNYRVLTGVKRGDLLVGEEEQVGWVRVRPPRGIRCYLSRDFVDAASGSGTVNADHVNLRPTPSTTHPPLLQLNRGDKVRILAEHEGWLEIEAPPAVGCWTSKEYVREVGPYTGKEQTVDVVGVAEAPAAERGPEHPTGEPPTGGGEHPTGPDRPAGGSEHPTPPDRTAGGSGTGESTAGAGSGGTDVGGPGSGIREPGGTESGSGETREPAGGTGDADVREPAGGTPETGGREPGTGEPPGPGWADPETGAGMEPDPRAGESVAPPAGDGRGTFEDAMRLTRIEDEKEVRDQDFRPAIRQLDTALALGLSGDLQMRAEIELKRLQANQKILDELRSQDRELRAITDAERRRQREEAGKGRPEPFLAEGYLDGVGKLINRPASHKLVKGKKTLYFLTSIKYNLNQYYGKMVGVRGKVIDAPGWPNRVIIVESIEVVGE